MPDNNKTISVYFSMRVDYCADMSMSEFMKTASSRDRDAIDIASVVKQGYMFVDNYEPDNTLAEVLTDIGAELDSGVVEITQVIAT